MPSVEHPRGDSEAAETIFRRILNGKAAGDHAGTSYVDVLAEKTSDDEVWAEKTSGTGASVFPHP
jgi:hypothetical protein